MPASTHDKQQPYDLSNFTVMLVEDSTYMQTLIAEMLKVFRVGDIVACSNVKEACELLTIMQARTKSRYVNSVDIILTDWLMPKEGGEVLLKWIRENEQESISFLPVVVVSGYTTEKLTHVTRDLGANEILVKPISSKLLASRICSVIDSPRPFIQTSDFFGPDRRRQDTAFKGSDQRSKNQNVIEMKS